MEEELLKYLDEQGIDYERYEHPAVFTCEEARALVPAMSAAETKNIFLRDRKGKRHFLLVVDYDHKVDLKALAPLLNAEKLSLGSPDRLFSHLGVEPGSVSILALFADKSLAVELYFDSAIAMASALRCHPMVNTATLALKASEIRRFLETTGHKLNVIGVPTRA